MIGLTGTRRIYLVVTVALLVLVSMVALLMRTDTPATVTEGKVVLFCAAGMRVPVESIRAEYERERGVRVEVQYGGSNTLLNQLQVSKIADLYLAADDTYLGIARDKGAIKETIPLATMRPVIVVQTGNPKAIHSINDLLGESISVALGNPDQAAIGKRTRDALRRSGHWQKLTTHTTENGVFKPTVPDVANSVKIGSVDAGVVWSATASQYPDLEAIRTPELDKATSMITVGVTTFSRNPALALDFARYLAGSNRGLPIFEDTGFESVDGDPWEEHPEITFFSGSVNRGALEPIIKRFEQREGVSVNTVYNGCGILTAQMKAIDNKQESGFPDTYMACDTYYLDVVQNLFEDGLRVSDTEIVIVVAEGNPKNIKSLTDLTRPGIRLAIGQPDQCTIGILTKRLLKDAGLYQTLIENNVVTQTPTSSMLVPAVTTSAADAVLAYRTDTLAENAKLDVVAIDSRLARATQPFAVSRSTKYRQLSQRLLETISNSQSDFESAGFIWRLDKEQTPGQ